MPASAQAWRLERTYTAEAGLSPTRTVASPTGRPSAATSSPTSPRTLLGERLAVHERRAHSALLASVDAFDDDRLAGAIPRVPRDVRDLVDDVHAGRDLPEDRVLPVEPGALLGGDDEELAAVRVGAAVRHRERAADDRPAVRLVLELVARPTGAVPARAAALDHEVRNDAMERQAVVVALGGKLDEVPDGLGRVLVVELDVDRAVVGVERCVRHARHATC